MNNQRAFDALCAEWAMSGWPRFYRDDLFFHDRRTLDRLPEGLPFGWMVREAGTWLIRPKGYFDSVYPHHKWSMGDASFLRFAEDPYYGQPHRCYYWTGSELLGFTSPELLRHELERVDTAAFTTNERSAA
jgi:hypothetical protein